MLLKRVITAIILIPLALSIIFYVPPAYFAFILGALILVGAWEWSALAGIQKTPLRILYLILVTAGILLGAFINEIWVLMPAILIWMWFFIATIRYEQGHSVVGMQHPFVRGLLGWIVLISTWVGLMTLETHPGFGPIWLTLFLLIVWSADIGAYFAGKFLGKTPLAPTTSPKKTWEGFLGGLVLSEIIAIVAGLILPFSWPAFFALLVLTFITQLFSVIGDLGVSLLKRLVGAKDTGNLFPGHGGVLDRMDSVAAAVIIFVLGAVLI